MCRGRYGALFCSGRRSAFADGLLQLFQGPFFNARYIALQLLQAIYSENLRRMERRDPLRYLAFLRFLQLGEAEFDNDFLVLGQLHPLNEADQQFPALPGGFNESLNQFFGPVLRADRAFFAQLQLLPLFRSSFARLKIR